MSKAKKHKLTTGRKIRYAVYFLIIVLLAAICLLPGGRIAFRDKIIALFPDPSPSIIALPADPVEMGRVHGSEFKYSIKLLCKLYLEPIVKGSKYQDHYKNAKAVF
ncbi:MAG: hypothetical protein WC071_14215, partial [Victivallaceae bacterium]